MASIASSIARIKQDALGALDRRVIEKVCAEFGHAWRERELDPATMRMCDDGQPVATSRAAGSDT